MFDLAAHNKDQMLIAGSSKAMAFVGSKALADLGFIVTRWISDADELPPHGETVAIYDKVDDELAWGWIEFDGGEVWVADGWAGNVIAKKGEIYWARFVPPPVLK